MQIEKEEEKQVMLLAHRFRERAVAADCTCCLGGAAYSPESAVGPCLSARSLTSSSLLLPSQVDRLTK